LTIYLLLGAAAVAVALRVAFSRYQLRFKDRVAAADILFDILRSEFKSYNVEGKNLISVFGIPRGGAITADRLATRLEANFDVIIAMKLGEPENKENAIGAIAEDGTIYFNHKRVSELQLSQEYIETEISDTREEIRAMTSSYRCTYKPKPYDLKGRIVILVDDGAATGATIIAAARSIKNHGPERLIIAIPVAPQETLKLLKAEADRLLVISHPSQSNFVTIGQFYQNFLPVSHGQVIEIIRRRN
jgi:putative phosphoribosyl transferase